MPFKQRLERDEGVSHAGIWSKSISDKKSSSCKSFEAKSCLELRNSKEASVDGKSENGEVLKDEYKPCGKIGRAASCKQI